MTTLASPVTYHYSRGFVIRETLVPNFTMRSRFFVFAADHLRGFSYCWFMYFTCFINFHSDTRYSSWLKMTYHLFHSLHQIQLAWAYSLQCTEQTMHSYHLYCMHPWTSHWQLESHLVILQLIMKLETTCKPANHMQIHSVVFKQAENKPNRFISRTIQCHIRNTTCLPAMTSLERSELAKGAEWIIFVKSGWGSLKLIARVNVRRRSVTQEIPESWSQISEFRICGTFWCNLVSIVVHPIYAFN